jgi:D-arabinose 1-dehydrogenase-like Zn-dependent alcohol dehydrogenase
MVRVYGNNDDGGHAPYLKVPANTLVPLPPELSFAAGAAISCGTGTAYNALVRLNLSARHTIAIFGQGPVGLSATQLAHALNARVIAIDVNAQRLQRAREFGADALIDSAKVDALEALRELTHGIGVDCALETSGASSARIAAVRATKIWGVCCFVGEGGDVTISVSPDMIRRQVREIHCRARHRCRPNLYRSLVARSGRRSLSAVRPRRRRQGRVSDVERVLRKLLRVRAPDATGAVPCAVARS